MKGKGPIKTDIQLPQIPSADVTFQTERGFVLSSMNYIFFIVDDNDVLSINHGDEKEGTGASHRLSFLFPLTISFLMYRPQLWDLLL
jgi:hypothetical protein